MLQTFVVNLAPVSVLVIANVWKFQLQFLFHLTNISLVVLRYCLSVGCCTAA